MPYSSYRMFGLNSIIFPRSNSTQDLQSSPQRETQRYTFAHAATDPVLPHISEETQASLLDRPDDTITALPPTRRGRSETRRVPGTNTEKQSTSPKRKKASSVWSRLKESIKASIRRLSKKKKNTEKTIEIGGPTDFQRVGGAELLGPQLGHGRGASWETIDEDVQRF